MSKPRRNKDTRTRVVKVPPKQKYSPRHYLQIEVDHDTFMFFKDYELTMYNYKVDVSSLSHSMYKSGWEANQSWVRGDYMTTLDLQARMVHKQ